MIDPARTAKEENVSEQIDVTAGQGFICSLFGSQCQEDFSA